MKLLITFFKIVFQNSSINKKGQKSIIFPFLYYLIQAKQICAALPPSTDQPVLHKNVTNKLYKPLYKPEIKLLCSDNSFFYLKLMTSKNK